jgi:hypothetical protein
VANGLFAGDLVDAECVPHQLPGPSVNWLTVDLSIAVMWGAAGDSAVVPLALVLFYTA